MSYSVGEDEESIDSRRLWSTYQIRNSFPISRNSLKSSSEELVQPKPNISTVSAASSSTPRNLEEYDVESLISDDLYVVTGIMIGRQD